MKDLTWEQVYDLPLTSNSGSYLWSKSGVMALQFTSFDTSKEFRQKIKNLINGKSVEKIEGITNNSVDFYKNGTAIFCIRGWGNLTGTGALNFPENKAIEIQDGFIEHVLKSISK